MFFCVYKVNIRMLGIDSILAIVVYNNNLFLCLFNFFGLLEEEYLYSFSQITYTYMQNTFTHNIYSQEGDLFYITLHKKKPTHPYSYLFLSLHLLYSHVVVSHPPPHLSYLAPPIYLSSFFFLFPFIVS